MIRASRRQAVELAKAERKAKRKAEKSKSAKMAKERKKKEIKLNTLTSISGSESVGNSNRSCFTCGSGDHFRSECPQRRGENEKRGYPGGDDDGPSRKALKTR